MASVSQFLGSLTSFSDTGISFQPYIYVYIQACQVYEHWDKSRTYCLDCILSGSTR